MAIDKIPPRPEEGNVQKSVSAILDYLYYMREQINYELAIVKKNIDREADNGSKTEEKLNGVKLTLDELQKQLEALASAEGEAN